MLRSTKDIAYFSSISNIVETELIVKLNKKQALPASTVGQEEKIDLEKIKIKFTCSDNLNIKI